MLRELSAQRLALIEGVRVELERGSCGLDGQTEAGKSLLLTALMVTGVKWKRRWRPQARGRPRLETVDLEGP